MDKKNVIKILVSIIIIGFLFALIIAYANKAIQNNYINNMYSDIKTLDNKISLYYIEKNALPITEEKIEFNNSINPNDDDVYYKLDMSKMIDINLIYGKERNYGDFYIINNKSHTVYYFNGIEIDGERIYTRQLNYQNVEEAM